MKTTYTQNIFITSTPLGTIFSANSRNSPFGKSGEKKNEQHINRSVRVPSATWKLVVCIEECVE